MIDWSALHGAYGPADAIPGLLERAADCDQDAIDHLRAHLCHQGTISPESIAALPWLADIAEAAVPGDWALHLAGAIAGGLLQGHHGADEEVARQGPTLERLRDAAVAPVRVAAACWIWPVVLYRCGERRMLPARRAASIPAPVRRR